MSALAGPPAVRLVRARRTFPRMRAVPPGDVVALDDVTLDVAPGESVGLLGPNGAGKTTLLQLVAGLRRPTAGTVALFGQDPRRPAARVALGTTPQETGLPPTLRVAEVVAVVAGHYPDPVPARELLERFGLADLARRQTGGLSGGQRRRLAVALAFVGRPRLVLLDEPTTGLDVASRRALWDAVREHTRTGGALLLTSHYLEEVEALSERVVVVDRGRALVDGDLDAVRARVRLRRVVLTAPADPGLSALDGAEQVRSEGDRHEVWTADADALVRSLVLAGVPFRDLEVSRATLEEAFLALTGGAARQDEEVPA